MNLCNYTRYTDVLQWATIRWILQRRQRQQQQQRHLRRRRQLSSVEQHSELSTMLSRPLPLPVRHRPPVRTNYTDGRNGHSWLEFKKHFFVVVWYGIVTKCLSSCRVEIAGRGWGVDLNSPVHVYRRSLLSQIRFCFKFQYLSKISNISTSNPPVLLGQFQHWVHVHFICS